jgi:hypothetical protein
MVAYLSLVVCVIGLLIYLAFTPSNGRAARVGEIMFAAGLLAFLLRVSEVLRFG